MNCTAYRHSTSGPEIKYNNSTVRQRAKICNIEWIDLYIYPNLSSQFSWFPPPPLELYEYILRSNSIKFQKWYQRDQFFLMLPGGQGWWRVQNNWKYTYRWGPVLKGVLSFYQLHMGVLTFFAMCYSNFSLPQIVCPLGGSIKIGSHVYFLLIVAMVLLLWHQIVISGHHGSIRTTFISNNNITQKTCNKKYTWLPFLLLPPSGCSIWGSENCCLYRVFSAEITWFQIDHITMRCNRDPVITQKWLPIYQVTVRFNYVLSKYAFIIC